MKQILRLAILAIAATAAAQDIPELPSLREQAEIRQGWLKDRLEDVLPRLMRENHVDMWIVQMSEYNEDPSFRALVAPTRFAARRRSIFVFYDRGPEEGLERLTLGGGDQGGVYTTIRERPENPERELYLDAQWRTLRQVVEERQPEVIGIDVSHTHAFLRRSRVGRARAPRTSARAEVDVAIRAGRARCRSTTSPSASPSMLPYYDKMMEIVHGLIATAFSSEVITPGVTTNDRRRVVAAPAVHDRAMDSWFQPSVAVQRKGETLEG